MAKARPKTQPQQDDALFKERKPRKRRTTQAALVTPPAPVSEHVPYVMPAGRVEAVEDWLNSEQDPCAICEVPLLVRDPRRWTKQGLAHVACADAVPPFEFPPMVKLYRDHEVLWLDRGYDMFRAGYYVGKLYQCGPGNIYGHFGSFGLDEKTAIEDLGIELIQVWTKTEAWQIDMETFQEKGTVAHVPLGSRWLVPLDEFQHAEREVKE